MKNKEIDKFAKLSSAEKGKLTLSWLADLVQSNNLTIQDVMDIINNVDTTFSKLDKFNSMIITNRVNPSTISRLFGYGYAKSMRVINLLIKEQAIVKFEDKYKIVDKEKFKQVGIQLFKGEKNEQI
ncbi:MAG: hypothetical protein J6Q13_03055 [Clostridia bacterium]|nr:hypothetical protein [Clostridia bacterium]